MTTAPQPTPQPQGDPRQHKLLLTVRAALIMVLAALDEYLGLERTRETRRERKERNRTGGRDVAI